MIFSALDLLLKAVPGVLVVAAGLGIYWTVRHGVPAAAAKLKAWWNKGKADVAALEQKLAPELSALRADVDALKVKVGL